MSVMSEDSKQDSCNPSVAFEDQPLKCLYDDCTHLSRNDKARVDHMAETHEGYCRRCKFVGKDWIDLMDHKIQVMIPWLVPGKGTVEKGRKLKHVVCEFCGEDFGSLGGRVLHQKRMHQAEQHIECPGYQMVLKLDDYGKGCLQQEKCPAIFGRPSQMIRHIEDGHCRYITRKELETECAQKHIVKQIMSQPEQFILVNSHNPGKKQHDMLYDDETADGGIGISLMDHEESKHAADAWPPLEPKKQPQNIIDQNEPMMGHEDSNIPGLLEHELIEYGRSSTAGQTSSLNSSSGNSSSSAKHATEGGVSSKLSAWASTDNTAATLSPNSSLNPSGITSQAKWEAIRQSKLRTSREDDKTNLFRSRFWDPGHEDYDAGLFMTETGEYHCPFPDCQTSFNIFPTEERIAAHLRQEHGVPQTQCKACFRNFKSLSALVMHYEASARGGKCRIARAEGFEKVLDEATGGFLSAERIYDEKVYGLDAQSNGEDGDQRPEGVRSHVYQAQLPSRAVRW